MDNVNNPKHYNQYTYEVIELTDQFSFNLGNVFKYILRAPYKGKKEEDLKKAAWYLRRVIEKREVKKITSEQIGLALTYNNLMVCSILCALKCNEWNVLSSYATLLEKGNAGDFATL